MIVYVCAQRAEADVSAQNMTGESEGITRVLSAVDGDTWQGKDGTEHQLGRC